MDRLEPARALIVDVIATLEDATEALMPGQAPNSSADEIFAGIAVLRAVAETLIKHADQLEASVEGSKP
jgi:hypothetical protein